MNRKQMMCVALSTVCALTAVVMSDARAQAQVQGGAASASAQQLDAKAVKAANRKLRKDVIHVLARTKGLSVSNITVRADSGAVTLQGAVPEQAQIELAARAAASVPGVTSVKNALTLSTF
ncbi:BON domain-containing protein [Paraburkholderia sp. JHI869]|uniref:BON domain-containing protein n=1 Tax=Paraburkholderia sp. JHI869 TaxID=3112959 RepID=UPI00317594AB